MSSNIQPSPKKLQKKPHICIHFDHFSEKLVLFMKSNLTAAVGFKSSDY